MKNITQTVLVGALMFVGGALAFGGRAVSAVVPCLTVTPTSTPATAFPTAAADTGTQDNPVPLGTQAVVVLSKNNQDYTFNVTITSAEYGDATVAKLKKSSFAENPPDGVTYLLFQVQGAYVDGPKGSAGDLSFLSFRSLGGGQLSSDAVVEPPDPQLRFQGFVGAKFKGWAALPLYISDSSPLIVLGVGYDGSGGTYFATKR